MLAGDCAVLRHVAEVDYDILPALRRRKIRLGILMPAEGTTARSRPRASGDRNEHSIAQITLQCDSNRQPLAVQKVRGQGRQHSQLPSTTSRRV